MESLQRYELENINGGAVATLPIIVKALGYLAGTLGAVGAGISLFSAAYGVGKDIGYTDAKYEYYDQLNDARDRESVEPAGDCSYSSGRRGF